MLLNSYFKNRVRLSKCCIVQSHLKVKAICSTRNIVWILFAYVFIKVFSPLIHNYILNNTELYLFCIVCELCFVILWEICIGMAVGTVASKYLKKIKFMTCFSKFRKSISTRKTTKLKLHYVIIQSFLTEMFLD